MQRDLARRDENLSFLKIPTLDDLRFPRLDVFDGDLDMRIEPLALWGQPDAVVRPYEERTAELALKVLYRARQVRLAVEKQLRRLRVFWYLAT